MAFFPSAAELAGASANFALPRPCSCELEGALRHTSRCSQRHKYLTLVHPEVETPGPTIEEATTAEETQATEEPKPAAEETEQTPVTVEEPQATEGGDEEDTAEESEEEDTAEESEEAVDEFGNSLDSTLPGAGMAPPSPNVYICH